jgi:glutamine amidotransferase
VTAWSTLDGDRFPAAVRSGNVVGVQFHPEKSSAPGVAFIHAFLQSIPTQRTCSPSRP